MWSFNKARKMREAPGLTSLEQQLSAIKMAEMEMRIASLEQAIIELCYSIRAHLDRMDANTMQLDKNMHNLAAMALKPSKDLLNGGSEPN